MDANVLLAREGRQGLNTPGNAGLHGKVQGLDEHYSPVAYLSPSPNSIFSNVCYPISNHSHPYPQTTISGDKIW